ncbi:thrombospondin type 3 repeat-containing protein [Leifsonia sp. Leaf264]|uniref:thrombospondin type 3 repeat-containing protein n=1 Tax=Leifsonia sp. Leaf264 TaxID=1736314 RepID=UPI00138F316C|nr:thrombospondin type 3 repeat-containing protein [Leifsonia sp. Leaf264]
MSSTLQNSWNIAGAHCHFTILNLNQQSFVQTCDEESSDSTSIGYERSDRVSTIVFRRTVCDISVDSDGDGMGDCAEYEQKTSASDTDTDDDGIPDPVDPCGTDPVTGAPSCTTTPPPLDTDSDGIPDATDTDDDNDGVPDTSDPAPTDPSVPPPPPANKCTTPQSNPVLCYAPEVRLHPGETNFPMGVDEFAAASALRWSHDWACPDDTVVRAGQINLTTLGDGGYDHQETTNWTCRHTGTRYNSAQLTRPDNTTGKPSGLDRREGFFLDLPNAMRVGDQPVNGKVSSPLSYNFVPGKYITYWFMYGFNPAATAAGALVDRHEGEWERIMVNLNADNTAKSVQYFVHTCRPETWPAVPWAAMTDSTAGNGAVSNGTHPIVYSAQGSHASYPWLVDLRKSSACGRVEGRGDVTVRAAQSGRRGPYRCETQSPHLGTATGARGVKSEVLPSAPAGRSSTLDRSALRARTRPGSVPLTDADLVCVMFARPQQNL